MSKVYVYSVDQIPMEIDTRKSDIRSLGISEATGFNQLYRILVSDSPCLSNSILWDGKKAITAKYSSRMLLRIKRYITNLNAIAIGKDVKPTNDPDGIISWFMKPDNANKYIHIELAEDAAKYTNKTYNINDIINDDLIRILQDVTGDEIDHPWDYITIRGKGSNNMIIERFVNELSPENISFTNELSINTHESPVNEFGDGGDSMFNDTANGQVNFAIPVSEHSKSIPFSYNLGDTEINLNLVPEKGYYAVYDLKDNFIGNYDSKNDIINDIKDDPESFKEYAVIPEIPMKSYLYEGKHFQYKQHNTFIEAFDSEGSFITNYDSLKDLEEDVDSDPDSFNEYSL